MRKIYFLLATLLACISVTAQDGSLDTSFNANIPIDSGTVSTMDNSENPIVAYSVSNTPPVVKKYNNTGNATLTINGFTNGYISALCVLSNGDIVIGGSFTNYAGTGQNYIIKVSPTGVYYSSFTPNIPSSLYNILVIKEQPGTGKILIGGMSNSGTNLICLNANGTTDYTFNAGGTGVGGTTPTIYDIKFYPDGSVLIGGNFSTYNGYTKQKIARLNSNGTLDTSFNVSGINGTVLAITLDNNNAVLIGGNFTFSGTTRKHFIRVNSSGALDTNFVDPTITNPGGSVTDVKAVASLDDGSILIGGTFGTTGGFNRRGISRLAYSGYTHYCFNSDPGLGNPFSRVQKIFVKQNKDFYICGDFPTYNNYSRKSIARLKGKPLNITANNDSGTVTVAGGTAVSNVLANDVLNGSPITLSNNSLTQISSSNTGISLNTSTGAVTVAANTPAGTYTLVYQVCSQVATCTCDSATVTITVTQSITANNDVYQMFAGSTIGVSVRMNDNVNGVQATSSNSTVSLVNPPSGFSFSTSGNLSVAASVTPGIYTLTYQLCATPNNTFCDTATITVSVLGVINAVDDTASAVIGAGLQFNVLSNDTYSGAAATTSNVYISLVTSVPSPITFNTTTGTVTVPASAPSGTYTFTYKICDSLSSYNCSQATVTITVGTPVIIANDDNFMSVCLNGLTGDTSGDVTANDTFNGQPVNDSQITITLINDGGLNNVTISPTGIITIPANTPFGTYVLDYSICYTYNGTSVCDTATVNICINNGLNPGTGANNTVFAVELQPDGYILIGGAFTTYNNVPRNRIARLKPDLSLDESFDPNAIGFNNVVYSIALQSNRILVGGRFTATTTGVPKNCLARLYPDGSLDNSFVNNIFQMSPEYPTSIPQVNCIKFQSNGGIIAGGNFDMINNSPGFTKTQVARFSPSGVSDNTFTSALIDNIGNVWDMYVMPDNSILVGGTFLKVPSGLAILYKVSANGAFDTSFTIGKHIDTSIYERVNAIERTSSGLLLGGYFASYNHVGPKNIAQISASGTLFPFSSFNPQLSSNAGINSVAVDPNTLKIIVGGDFTSFNNNNTKLIARLNSNGSFDPSFVTGAGFYNDPFTNGAVRKIKLQPDGKIVVGGTFTAYNNNQANYVTRLVPNSNPVIQGRLMAPHNGTADVSVSPNPSNGIFNLNFTNYEEQEFEMSIFNTLGQLIKTQKVNTATNLQVDLSNHQAGNYFIRLVNNKETITKIIVVKN
ncbi:T9SS type A sorting domain-containing protein [Flavobacterium rhizosphaerae]|uniref:T9SS type A sorting domain-containing protein n=1 Tax=Flavobacterium rhizosphaerae TaxID=3163298 RepID=A0ABW8YWU5_9FLAO